MSRTTYSDECEHLELFRGNVRRSIRGYFGQARLKELRDALLALPVKVLHADIFAEGTKDAPRVCALGAWALAKTGDPETARSLVSDPDSDNETADSLKQDGWPKLVVLDVIYENDRTAYVYETVEGPANRWESLPQLWREETPEERYTRVLAWVNEQIIKEAPSPPIRSVA